MRSSCLTHTFPFSISRIDAPVGAQYIFVHPIHKYMEMPTHQQRMIPLAEPFIAYTPHSMLYACNAMQSTHTFTHIPDDGVCGKRALFLLSISTSNNPFTYRRCTPENALDKKLAIHSSQVGW